MTAGCDLETTQKNFMAFSPRSSAVIPRRTGGCLGPYEEVKARLNQAQVYQQQRPTYGSGIVASGRILREEGSERHMAEGEGFEPPLPVKVKRFSRPPVSTAHTSLRGRVRASSTVRPHSHNDG